MSHAFYLDVDRCTGCFACAVACMDQNDLEIGAEPDRLAAGLQGRDRRGRRRPAALRLPRLHALRGCPLPHGLPHRRHRPRERARRAVKVNAELCIGCHSCSIACPFGVPRFGKDGTMQKCDLCSVRLENGLEPACVRVCPTKALRQGDPNAISQEVEKKAAARLAAGS